MLKIILSSDFVTPMQMRLLNLVPIEGSIDN